MLTESRQPLLTARTGRKRYFSLLTCFIGKIALGRRHRGSEKWNEPMLKKAKRDRKEHEGGSNFER